MKYIQLTQNQIAMVDDDDYEWLSKYKWCAVLRRSGYYAVRNSRVSGKNKTILMHREIMNTPENMECDHIHHNTLDNRKSQLRSCTTSQNAMNRGKESSNTSGYKGVTKKGNGWQAQIKKNKKPVFVKYFHTALEAAIAYDEAAREHHGDFANLNFQLEQEK